MLCSDLNGKEIRKGGDICTCIADSFCGTVEANTTLSSNCTPIKINLKKEIQISSYKTISLRNVIHSARNIGNHTVMILCGDRWLLDVLWRSFCYVFDCWITMLCT